MPAGHHARIPPSGERGQPRGHASFEEIDGITLQSTVIGTPTGVGVSESCAGRPGMGWGNVYEAPRAARRRRLPERSRGGSLDLTEVA